MSVESMAIVLHHSKATGAAKLVLLGIANHDGDGGSWPSVATLAKYANVKPRNVQMALEKLVGLGEIRRHIQAGGDHRIEAHRRPNRYDVLLSCPPDCDRTRHHKTRRDWEEIELSTRVTESSPGDAGVRGGVMPASPKPSFNQPNPRLNKESSVGKRAQARAACGDPANEAGTCLYACSTEFKMRQEQNR